MLILEIETIFAQSGTFNIKENNFYPNFKELNKLFKSIKLNKKIKNDPLSIDLKILLDYEQKYKNFTSIMDDEFLISECIDVMMSYNDEFLKVIIKYPKIRKFFNKYEFLNI